MSDSNTCDKCGAKRRDESKDLQNFVTKTVIGFITMTACFVLLKLFFPGVLAQPVSDQSTDIALLAMGTYTDNVTGETFTLYTLDASVSEDDALQSYYGGFANEPSLSARNWYDCNYPGGGIRLMCCGAAHGIGGFVSAVTSSSAAGYIVALLKEVDTSKRLDQKPRSACITRDGDNLCVSWATYATSTMTSAEETTISVFARECGVKGYSSEFKAVLANGDLLYVCVSNRAKGCSTSL
ncbi:hypothetical protein N7466_009702 [Penicillium verhagenii]|uniref:uncharacterized protein n=1 Tax=Penicillium verhagenii TaxID=1562060 RepID=UPI0025450BC9|nr:uncharacterized protein N7466_009702 [Penicillium verhagenii]KAJ5921376.1 hypothetical protein N7466_009702 [Penicillium verhagenii]